MADNTLPEVNATAIAAIVLPPADAQYYTAASAAGLSQEIVVTIPSGTVFATGSYTPTRSAETNLDSNVTPGTFYWFRQGAQVHFWGVVTAVDPTLAATVTSYELTLPVASNIGATGDVVGIGVCGAIAGMVAAISGSIANDTMKISWVSSDITAQAWNIVGDYRII